MVRRNGVSMDIRELRTEHIEFSGEIMDRVLRSAILNSNVIDVIQDNKRPFDELMSKYRCAIMEIETKFKVLNQEYSLEYGTAVIEMHKTSIKPGQKVLIVDDLIATGGTTQAMISLVERLGGEVAGVLVLIELAGLKGREAIAGYRLDSAIVYEGK